MSERKKHYLGCPVNNGLLPCTCELEDNPSPPPATEPSDAAKPETLEQWRDKCREMMLLLIECRDAIPAIPLAAAKLRGIDLALDKKIEACLKPWELPEGADGL